MVSVVMGQYLKAGEFAIDVAEYHSGDADVDDDDDPRAPAPAETLADYSSDPGVLVARADEARVKQTQLARALSVLDQRSRDIVEARWLSDSGQKLTLAELAGKYNVSAERIRQIEKRALEQMQLAVAD